MKVKEVIEKLNTYNPEFEFGVTLPPGWYKEDEANDVSLWQKKGWTIDSVDYIIVSEDKDFNFVCVCPLKDPGAESTYTNYI